MTHNRNGTLAFGVNDAVGGSEVSIALEPVPAEEIVSGSPQQGTLEFDRCAGCEVGLWELRGGTVCDTEADELFVVISGGATIELLDEGRSLHVKPGDLVRLTAGTRTRWTVRDHLRKLYITTPQQGH